MIELDLEDNPSIDNTILNRVNRLIERNKQFLLYYCFQEQKYQNELNMDDY